jgi:hypothetical protein
MIIQKLNAFYRVTIPLIVLSANIVIRHTKVHAMWRAQDFLHSTNSVLHIAELCHCNFGGKNRSQPQRHCKGLCSEISFCCSGNTPSVTTPRVPSAPMKSLVVSNPADDFLALLRVLITCPSGRTTVFSVHRHQCSNSGNVHLQGSKTTPPLLSHNAQHLLTRLLSNRCTQIWKQLTPTTSSAHHATNRLWRRLGGQLLE